MARVRWLGGVLALLVVTATGCWPQAGGGPGRGGVGDSAGLFPETIGDLTEVWSSSAGQGEAQEPLVVGGAAYVRTDGAVAALDLATGARRWLVGQPGTGMPAAVGSELHVPVSGRVCELRTLSLGSGQPAGSLTVGPDLFTGPDGTSSCRFGDAVAVGGTVAAPWYFVGRGPVFGCRQGAYIEGPGVAAVDVGADAELWEHWDTNSDCGAGAPLLPEFGQPSSDGTQVVVPWGSRVQSWPLACSGPCPTSWQPNVGGELVGPVVVLPDGRLAVATADGRVLGLDGATGAIAWWGAVGSTVSQPLAASSSRIYATGDDGRVVAFDAACGGDRCNAVWSATLASPASARPSIAGDVLFVGSADGTVSALRASGCGQVSCEPLWTGTTPAEITGGPAISAGRVLVGSADGTVTAFAMS